MSAVIARAKQHYQHALILEMITLFGVSLALIFWQGQIAFAFLMGSLTSFLPHCVFVYWFFFKQSTRNTSKMTTFYQGEAMKWLLTIVLIVGYFKWIPDLQIVVFFVGFFVALLLNNVIPFVLSKRLH